mgnify:CR=1 FL=1|tara:strand:+ start:75 stop:1127 length:1053 start_codon:yes stop_codon:yes gene_type:complete
MIDLIHYKPRSDRKIIFRCSKIYYFQVDEGFGGIGDRMVGLVSTFILSLLLNFDFRIYWIYPLKLSDIFNEKNNILWNKKDYDLKILNEIRLMDHDIFDENKIDLLVNKIHNLNEDLSIVSNKFFVYHLIKNKNLYERIKLLNINEISVYHDVMHILFNFNDSLQIKYNKLLFNFSEYFTIGIQIRSYIHEYNIELNDSDYNEYIDYIDNIIDKNKNKNIMLFICSDTKSTSDYFSKKYNKYKQLIISGDIVHLEKTSIYNKDLNNNIRLFIEIYGLGKCNELIITNSSNFGRLGSLRTLKKPFICYKLISPHPNRYNRDTFKMPDIDLKKKYKKFSWYNILTKDNLYNI